MDVDFKEMYTEPYKILGLNEHQRRNGESSPIHAIVKDGREKMNDNVDITTSIK